MDIDYQALREQLERGDREALIEMAFNSDLMPKKFKALAYVKLNGMGDDEIRDICDKIKNALPFLETGDKDGLAGYALELGIPAPIVEMIKAHANTGNSK